MKQQTRVVRLWFIAIVIFIVLLTSFLFFRLFFWSPFDTLSSPNKDKNNNKNKKKKVWNSVRIPVHNNIDNKDIAGNEVHHYFVDEREQENKNNNNKNNVEVDQQQQEEKTYRATWQEVLTKGLEEKCNEEQKQKEKEDDENEKMKKKSEYNKVEVGIRCWSLIENDKKNKKNDNNQHPFLLMYNPSCSSQAAKNVDTLIASRKNSAKSRTTAEKTNDVILPKRIQWSEFMMKYFSGNRIITKQQQQEEEEEDNNNASENNDNDHKQKQQQKQEEEKKESAGSLVFLQDHDESNFQNNNKILTSKKFIEHSKKMKELAIKTFSSGNNEEEEENEEKTWIKRHGEGSYEKSVKCIFEDKILHHLDEEGAGEDSSFSSTLDMLRDLDSEMIKDYHFRDSSITISSTRSAVAYFIIHLPKEDLSNKEDATFGHKLFQYLNTNYQKELWRSLLKSIFGLSNSRKQGILNQVHFSFVIPQIHFRTNIAKLLSSYFSSSFSSSSVVGHCKSSWIRDATGSEEELTVDVKCITAAAAIKNFLQKKKHFQNKKINNYDTKQEEKQIYCNNLNIKFSSALKFGSKTGVYVASSVSKNEEKKSVLVKHYNLLQYTAGFSGLHHFLMDPIHSHPVIHIPNRACVFSSKKTSSSTTTNNNNEEEIFSDSVLQFQPLVSHQQSLSKFMAKIHSSHSKISFPWKQRLNLVLQLLCSFSFLHSHPRGPFSFDDNHPDQYLVVVDKSINNDDDDDDILFKLKMVDIDTLQKAENDDSNNNDDVIIPPNSNEEERRQKQKQQQQQETIHALKCRCFYCRGRSNCLFVNSYEGYQSCGQNRGQHNRNKNSNVVGDDDDGAGNRELKNTPNGHNKKLCSLLTDSWYLGQLLFFMIRGNLVFPVSMDMKHVISAIDFAVHYHHHHDKNSNVNEENKKSILEEIFPHLVVKKDNNNKKKSKVSDEEIYNQVIYDLLIKRVTPKAAAEKLLPLCEKYGLHFPNKEWCPDEMNQHNVDFHGLRIVP